MVLFCLCYLLEGARCSQEMEKAKEMRAKKGKASEEEAERNAMRRQGCFFFSLLPVGSCSLSLLLVGRCSPFARDGKSEADEGEERQGRPGKIEC